MNFEADDLLGYVDDWKYRLHEKLGSLTPARRAAFWNEARRKARAAGLPLAAPARRAKGQPKRISRATG